MITSQLMKQAIETSDRHCHGESCPHTNAMAEIGEFVFRHIATTGMESMSNGISPSAMIFSEGVHVGYRLRELELETPSPTSPIN